MGLKSHFIFHLVIVKIVNLIGTQFKYKVTNQPEQPKKIE